MTRNAFVTTLENVLKTPIVDIVPFPSSVNSTTFRVTTESGSVYWVKQYIVRPGDSRNRLKTEFQALKFLSRNGVRSIPTPIAKDTKHRLGVYGFVQGDVLRNVPVSLSDLRQTIGFLDLLHTLRKKTTASDCPNASESCFSLDEYEKNIKKRRSRFNRLIHTLSPDDGLNRFLLQTWDPVWKQVRILIRNEAKKRHVSWFKVLDKKHQTLSPSDFGFHNTIRDRNGNLTFIDFEYFGWDDPAKLICDFLLHPGMDLSRKQKQWFLKKAYQMYQNDPTLAKRLPLVYVFLGLKWSLIILNCFFDGVGTAASRITKKRQLAKAKKNLKTIHL